MCADFVNSFPFSIKIRMVAYLSVLLTLGAWGVGNWVLFVRGIAVVTIYALADVTWTFLRDKKLYLPVSSLISGFIIALLLAPATPLWLMALVPLLAVFSKQVIHLGFHRHVFNPAALSLVIASFFFPAAVSWWGVSWGTIPFIVVALAAVFIVTGQRRWHEVLPFLGLYAAISLTVFILSGLNLNQLPIALKTLLWDGTALFFASVMLIEPMTSQFPGVHHRMLYALSAAAGTGIMTQLPFDSVRIDPLLGGVLLANAAASFLFLRRQKV